MKFERIGDNTVKLYISYIDMEERGFDREEIWSNRDLGEELFWEVMEEADEEEEFLGDGPLWIQIHALDSGLEMFVTKYAVSKDEQSSPLSSLKDFMGVERDKIDEFLNQNADKSNESEEKKVSLEFVLSFAEFENIIQLAKNQNLEHVNTTLYSFDNKYYLHVLFDEEYYFDKDDELVDNALSTLLEYGVTSNITVHRLAEYGKLIIADDVFTMINEYFS